jgi:hypothetical protein
LEGLSAYVLYRWLSLKAKYPWYSYLINIILYPTQKRKEESYYVYFIYVPEGKQQGHVQTRIQDLPDNGSWLFTALNVVFM